MSFGFEQAGFDVCSAVELDPVHACVHHFNFPYAATICASVSEVSGKEILERAAISKNTEIELLVGGAPCQGFSMIGQRALDDPRNRLVKDYLRILSEIRPKAFVFENVKGITLGRHRQVLNELIEDANAIGYQVVSPWKVLNANNFGVPQNRERLILVGFRDDVDGPFSYPSPITNPQSSEGDLFVEPTPTCHDALSDLPDVDCYEELVTREWLRTSLPEPVSMYGRSMRGMTNESWRFGHQRDWDDGVLTSSLRTSHTEISKRRFREAEEGRPAPISRLFKLPRDGQSNTLRAGTDSSRGAFSSPRPIHYEYERVITVREMARLHSFPDWFRFHGTKWHGARQIGNAVPPLLAYHIGLSILQTLKLSPKASDRVISLGDPKLLELTLSQACDYWGVPNPISKRNMKSGAKKRKQKDIELERAAGSVQ